MASLPRALHGLPFTVQQAADAGLSFYELQRLVQAGVIELVVRGIYRQATGDISEEDQFRIATLRVGTPSAICLISALSFYHLTDTIPKKTWIMVPVQKRTRDRSIELHRARDPQWTIGIKAHDGYSITTLERTLIDCLVHRTRLGSRIGVEALREGIDTKQVKLGHLVDIAQKLGVAHRVIAYIEALA